MRRQYIVCGLLALSLASRAAGEELALQAAGAAAAPTTLWNFLGIPQGVNKIRDATSNKFGDRPASERKPALKRIADPKNLESDNPAIKKAAQVKAAEDQAPQKIKALKYLARMGCGCYDQDGKITEAFMAALDDCTEEVRFQAAIAILDAANNNCETCNGKRCCSEELSLKLAKIAYEKNDKCCWLEPSERVRMAAADALKACCCCSQNVPPGLETVPSPPPEEKPKEVVPPEPPPAETVPNSARRVPGPSQSKGKLWSARRNINETASPTSPATESKDADGLEIPTSQRSKATLTSSRRNAEERGVGSTEFAVDEPRPDAQGAPRAAAPHVHGTIDDINFETATAQVRFSGPHGLRVGHRLIVQHKYLLGPSSLGEMEVIAAGTNAVTVRPVGAFNFAKLAVGDEATTVKAKKSFFRPRSAQPPAEEQPAVAEQPARDRVAKDSWELLEPETDSRRHVRQREAEPVKQTAAAPAAATGQKSSRRQVAMVAANPARPITDAGASREDFAAVATDTDSSGADFRISDGTPSRDNGLKAQTPARNVLPAGGSSTLRMISDSSK